MARRDRYYLGHIYQPTTPRKPYGRRPWSRLLVEELPFYISVRHADDAPAPDAPVVAGGARRIAQPMPRGGVRWMLECPRCQRHVRQLYYRADLWDAAFFPQERSGSCRKCWGFAYRSQYQGRRPEAAPERARALAEQAKRTRDPEVRRRRIARARQVENCRIRRAMRHDMRKGQAFRVAVLPVLVRIQARERLVWTKAVLSGLRKPLDVRAVLAYSFALQAERAAVEDSPAKQWPLWAALTLQASVDAEMAANERASIVPPEPPREDEGFISDARLEAARANYAAWTARRAHQKAA